MNKHMLFGFAFLLLITAVTALSDSQNALSDSQIASTNAQITSIASKLASSDSRGTGIESIVKENGCQTNDMWQYNGACFRVADQHNPGNSDCWLCFSCWGPFCEAPRYEGC